jgi:hypothetical protein
VAVLQVEVVSSKATTTALSPAATSFVAAAQAALQSREQTTLSARDLQAVFTASVKLYAAWAEATQVLPIPPLVNSEVSATDVVIVASEMIRAVDLSPFDLSMWYRRAR